MTTGYGAALADGALEATVVGSFSRVGFAARRALFHWDADPAPDLAGRVVLVTGATSGIGLAASRALAARHAKVWLVGRDDERTEAARRQIVAATPGAQLSTVRTDLAVLDDVRACAAKVLVGGSAPAGEGYFVEPTVLADTTHQMRVVREEIFGPVLCAMKFADSDLDSIARFANDTDYGLAASIWTRDISTAHKLAKKIRAGSVRINTAGTVDPAMPLGGYKQSGWGRENGREGTEIYTEVKSVTVGLS